MAQHNQFTLLFKRRFLPLFLSLTSATFNDNIFKNALLVMLAFRLSEAKADALINLATGFYILPYFLFSVTAGQLADKYDKSQIIRILKLAEIFIVLLGAYGLIYNNQTINFIVLFLLASHTAIFSPVRYAILPQHLKRRELMGGNGLAQMGSFAGVLSGTIAGTLLAGYTNPGQSGLNELSATMAVIAVLGYIASRRVPQAPAPAPDLRIDWNPVSQAWRILRLTTKNPSVFYAILACSWFWLVSAAYLVQVPSLTKNVLGASEPVITIILCCLSIGVAAGSLMCETLSRGRITFGIVPIGALGMTLAGLGLGITTAQFETLSGASVGEYLRSDGAYAVLIYTALLGISGGVFIVPLYTIMQDRTDRAVRAQVLSLNNVMNALFTTIITLINIFILDVVKITIPQLFILMALINFAVMALLFYRLPEFIVHLLIWLSSHLLARTAYGKLKKIPKKSAALLTCNATVKLAPLLLMDTLQRPIRFILPQWFYQSPLMHFIFKNYNIAPIVYGSSGDKTQLSTEIRQALENGELMCLFYTQDQLDSLLTDIEKPLRTALIDTSAPLIPLVLQGLNYKARGNRNAKRFNLIPKVHISIGQPIAVENTNDSILTR
ncbi:MFS transporter [Microbulbifer sp. THAF38]|uniref:MFS transporter n=1 Tax=Microbulbifer sp. THAF38 TaxID=2587856 RepID=UPI0012681F20|nr:MFS transporter [Microbulbifer sp. THAF38]QFT53577.1 Lysophospholipid transporter LplT [Microbulbifer sp. THAF38]